MLCVCMLQLYWGNLSLITTFTEYFYTFCMLIENRVSSLVSDLTLAIFFLIYLFCLGLTMLEMVGVGIIGLFFILEENTIIFTIDYDAISRNFIYVFFKILGHLESTLLIFLMKTYLHWHKENHIDQWGRIKNPELNVCRYSQHLR